MAVPLRRPFCHRPQPALAMTLLSGAPVRCQRPSSDASCRHRLNTHRESGAAHGHCPRVTACPFLTIVQCMDLHGFDGCQTITDLSMRALGSTCYRLTNLSIEGCRNYRHWRIVACCELRASSFSQFCWSPTNHTCYCIGDGSQLPQAKAFEHALWHY